MEISPIAMAKMMLFAFVFGAISGCVFDALRAIRVLFSDAPRSRKLHRFCKIQLPFSKRFFCQSNRLKKIFLAISVFFCDAFFVIFSVCGIMLLNYFFNDGGLRGFTVLGAVLGFALYYFTLSKILLFLFEGLLFCLRYLIEAFFDLFYRPFLNIYNNFVKNIKKIHEKFRFRLEKNRKKVYNVCEILYDDASSSKGRVRIRASRDKIDRK